MEQIMELGSLKNTSFDYEKLRHSLRNSGYAILNYCLSKEICQDIMAFIDAYPVSSAEVNYGGTEKRIWQSEHIHSGICSFGNFADEVMKNVFSVEVKLKTVLSYSNFPINDAESFTNGRWHLDSLRNQYKLFCFLTETKDTTGPLEIIPGSHKFIFKLRALMKGKYLSHSDLGRPVRKYQRLDDAWVQQEISNLGGSLPFLCEAGTLVLVNTSAIHRARPCSEESRYALCAYYDHF